MLSVEVARANGNTGLDKLLNSAVGKIKEALGDTVSIAPAPNNSYGLAPVAAVTSDIHLQLTRAAAARQKLRMSYSSLSSGATGTRTIHPYQLHFARGEWLLIARDESKAAHDNPIRCFNIARIGELRALDEHFVRDLDYDGEQYVAEMFCAERGAAIVEVAVRFDAHQARYIRERVWHAGQSIEEHEDGGLTLRFLRERPERNRALGDELWPPRPRIGARRTARNCGGSCARTGPNLRRTGAGRTVGFFVSLCHSLLHLDFRKFNFSCNFYFLRGYCPLPIFWVTRT